MSFRCHMLLVLVVPQRQKLLFFRCSCLDRTNVAQFSAGVEALEQQLVVMGIRSSAKLDPSSNIIRVLIEMYVEIGDHIALQYGGSEAHKKVNVERSESSFHGPMGKVRRPCTVAIYAFYYLHHSLPSTSCITHYTGRCNRSTKSFLPQSVDTTATHSQID